MRGRMLEKGMEGVRDVKGGSIVKEGQQYMYVGPLEEVTVGGVMVGRVMVGGVMMSGMRAREVIV